MASDQAPDSKQHKPATVCVHGGYRATAENPAVVAPIVSSTTFLLDDEAYARMLSGRADEALIYTRIKNPSLDVVQDRIARLEGAERALVFASGMAAIHAAVMSCVKHGSVIVAPREIYGSAWDLFANLLKPLGIETRFVDMSNAGELERAIVDSRPAVVYAESISNPTLTVCDLRVVARHARAAKAALIVDATFATPILQRPLALGADLVLHSATKYMGGHSDLIGGVVAGSNARMQSVYRWMQLAGGCMDPHAAFLLDRGLKTLPLRMRAHIENAAALAEHLSRHPRVKSVLYPGLAAHRSHEIGRELLSGFGGMLSFVVAGGDAAALRCIRALELALEASSLGGVETLVSLPFNTSHARLSPAERQAAGIADGFVRVSVGIEDARDLIEDFDRALERSATA
ncbi:MAG: aminotransferase class I/II-fold pyridoxal phosphate-dependent enzyme [Planctomycetes bacterium]|nr:aminotransferase class I/II-fold pyridoxal phosphate-dependent enzyme [Planctomycetota bacterium]